MLIRAGRTPCWEWWKTWTRNAWGRRERALRDAKGQGSGLREGSSEELRPQRSSEGGGGGKAAGADGLLTLKRPAGSEHSTADSMAESREDHAGLPGLVGSRSPT